MKRQKLSSVLTPGSYITGCTLRLSLLESQATPWANWLVTTMDGCLGDWLKSTCTYDSESGLESQQMTTRTGIRMPPRALGLSVTLRALQFTVNAACHLKSSSVPRSKHYKNIPGNWMCFMSMLSNETVAQSSVDSSMTSSWIIWFRLMLNIK